MQNCVHEFVVFDDLIQSSKKLICAYCGHIREVYGDGTIFIKQQEGRVIYDKQSTNQSTSGETA